MAQGLIGGHHKAEDCRQTGKEEEGEIVRQLRQRVAILLVRDNMFDSRTPSFPHEVIDADLDYV